MSETEQAPEPSARHLSEADVNERVAAFPIVGIGASAGGLEALTLFLTALPADTGMGFVIVQHLTPGRRSTLAEVLARATPMPLCEVSDEAEVQPDHIYVIPPGRGMTIVGGRLQLFAQNREGRPSGIDQFFRALADDCGHKAIGVVLSGALSDGTLGLEEIKARGGVAFAQDETARHDSMPRHAIASGCVDFVLPPGEIAAEIARIAHHSYVTPSGVGIPAAQLDHQRITQVLRRATGVDFTQYKSSTLQRRITRRMLLHKLEAHQDYEEMLRNSAQEVDALYQDFLIGVTSFFRDPDTYDTLKSVVFPKLLADRSADEPVRVWSLGCSTGEEAYSLAIAFAEAAEELESPAMLQLFASDLNAAAVEKARTGLYPASIAQDVTPERLRRIIVEEKDGYRICKAIREQCIFARHNALADPPFSRMDLASCRNMLIYLEASLQQQVLQTLHFSLKPGGWLWLGSSESVGEARALYDSVDAGHKLFTRRLGPPPSLRTYPTARWHFPSSPVSARDSSQGDLHRDSERVLAANDMQSLIEQHDATHEELQSSNEELQSLNEELETSKEEIQSTNEELTTVNDELNLRNRELHWKQH